MSDKDLITLGSTAPLFPDLPEQRFASFQGDEVSNARRWNDRECLQYFLKYCREVSSVKTTANSDDGEVLIGILTEDEFARFAYHLNDLRTRKLIRKNKHRLMRSALEADDPHGPVVWWIEDKLSKDGKKFKRDVMYFKIFDKDNAEDRAHLTGIVNDLRKRKLLSEKHLIALTHYYDQARSPLIEHELKRAVT